jgi:hypothetical protein
VLAPVVGGLFMARWAGSSRLVIAACAAFGAAAIALDGGKRARRFALATAPITLIAALALSSPLAAWTLAAGQRFLVAQEGADGVVLVEEGRDRRRLRHLGALLRRG